MNERELDFFRKKHEGYEPYTSHAAIRAFESAIVPIEFFIYKSTSVKSIEEKPYDFDAIDRMLSRKFTDFQTTRFLIKIFNEMVKERDAERALFGAEGINSIESRYNKKIENLKQKLETRDSAEVKQELARLYYELALLNEKQKDIKKFFLKTAYNYLKDTQKDNTLSIKNLELLVNILLEFNLHKKALDTLKTIAVEEKPSLLLLMAKVEFKNKHYREVFNMLTELKQYGDSLDDESKKFIEYWTEHNDRTA
jgi:lipopolysaccharide biosynthesis regulator YciM